MQDIVIFLRLSRAVAGGVTAKANDQFIRFARSVDHVVPDSTCFSEYLTLLPRFLAPLHGIDYLTPSIVALAARKVFRHRIVVANPDEDRSLQYGSDLKTASYVLEDVTADSILDGVLALEPPL